MMTGITGMTGITEMIGIAGMSGAIKNGDEDCALIADCFSFAFICFSLGSQ